MSHLTATVERFSLHYDEDEAHTNPFYDGAVARLIKEARSIEVGGTPLFSEVNDNAGVIDFVFVGELNLKEFRRWVDLLGIWFDSFLND